MGFMFKFIESSVMNILVSLIFHLFFSGTPTIPVVPSSANPASPAAVSGVTVPGSGAVPSPISTPGFTPQTAAAGGGVLNTSKDLSLGVDSFDWSNVHPLMRPPN